MSRIFKEKSRVIPISKSMVWEAYKKVKKNKGGSGVDGVSFEQFDTNLEDNLYKLWNRLSSGSYFPPAVKQVKIPKGKGGTRTLGIPTISDRIGQQVVKTLLEPRLEAVFDASSYGYRPKKSSHQALSEVRKNIRQYAWVLDLDISKFFDTVNHEKLMKALGLHVEEDWIEMYVLRWLEAEKLDLENGERQANKRGTPQGGVISPLLANLYLHYAFDKWLRLHYPRLPFVRYADDIIIHCNTEEKAKEVLKVVQERIEDCDLSLHPTKTKVVYCKDYRRKLKKEEVQFDFLGFSFRPVSKKSSREHESMFLGFGPTLSKSSYQRIVKEIRATRFHKWTNATIYDIAKELNPKIRGWMHYYEKFSKWSLQKVFRNLHNRLLKWVLNRYKRFKGSKRKGFEYLRTVKKHYPHIFYHWSVGYPFI